MLEEERKYDVDGTFVLPDLAGCLPKGGRMVARPAVSLRATYYDTPDLRLARAGISLRCRSGAGAPDAGGRSALWTAKLPTAAPGVRQEISRPGTPGTMPSELSSLLTAYHRGARLQAMARLRTVHRVYELRDANDELHAEVADDTVSVLEGRKTSARFREIEVERHAGRRKLLKRVGAALLDAGAVTGELIPKHVRAIGAPAAQPPDLTPPRERLPRKASAGDVVTAALRSDIARIFANDPLVRLREPLPDGDTPVHQMRVGCRRLRSDLRTFTPLLNARWAGQLRTELAWIADVLGEARDAEVLRERLQRTAAADPLAPLDTAAVARIDADLAARHEQALQGVDEALGSPRYLALLELLLDAARSPELATDAGQPARTALPAVVARPWRQLVRGGRGTVGAGALDSAAPDEQWHAVRIRGKRARYAAGAVAGHVGGTAPDLARALGAVQDLLGEHQDAAVAAETWLAFAGADPTTDDRILAVTAGRLYERERASIRTVRAGFPTAWRTAADPRLTQWLAS